jgi:hypothetical protein
LVAFIDVELVDLDLGITLRAGRHTLLGAAGSRRSVWQFGG